MAIIEKMVKEANAEGYLDENADAKVCQDIVLKALSESSLNRNVTIKGGVVMRSITGDARRATQDMDIDFIRYSLSDESIRTFVQKLNCLPGIRIEQVGVIEELSQQDYQGKRVYVKISDRGGEAIESKIDLGVHKHLSIEQEEFCFDIACFDDGANLLINSREQMFAEKLLECFDEFIISDSGMRENTMQDIIRRVDKTFSNERYIKRLSESKKNWLGLPVDDVIGTVKKYIVSLEN